MGIIFVNKNEFNINSNCTIHKSGKLSFNTSAIKKLNINAESYIKVGYNEKDNSLENLFLVVAKDDKDGAFKVNKSGKYFHVNTQPFFDKMNVDYVKNNITYDISDHEENKMKMFKLQKKDKRKKKTA
jgi:hypothetical protein